MTKQSLLLVPGLLNDAELWRDQISALSLVADCHVADITGESSIEGMAAGILRDAPRKFALAGFSLGGFVAQEILRQDEARVTRLALINTSCRADTPERLAARRHTSALASAPGKFVGMGDRMLGTYLHVSNAGNLEMIGRLRGMMTRLGPEVLVRQNNAQRRDGSAVLSRFTRPALIVCGEADVITPLAESEHIGSLVPHAQFLTLANAGHLTPLEQPEILSEAMKVWLAA